MTDGLTDAEREKLRRALGPGLTDAGFELWVEWRVAEGYSFERMMDDALDYQDGQIAT